MRLSSCGSRRGATASGSPLVDCPHVLWARIEALESGRITFISCSDVNFPMGTCMPVFGEGRNVEEKEGEEKEKGIGQSGKV